MSSIVTDRGIVHYETFGETKQMLDVKEEKNPTYIKLQ